MKNLLSTKLLAALAVAATAALAAPASAATVIGAELVVANDGNVTATFVSSDAGFTDLLYFVGTGSDVFLFNNQTSSAGDMVDLGFFTAGTVLSFYITTPEDNGYTYFTGDGSSNPDGIAHAAVTDLGDSTQVGFEDLFGGGDFDYNDVVYSFTNTAIAPIPLPAAGLMLVGGIAALGAFKRRKTAKAV